MHKHVEVAAALLLSACAGSDPSEPVMQTGSPAEADPPPDAGSRIGVPPTLPWRSCRSGGQSDCPELEQCVRDSDGTFAICLRDCVTVDDCLAPTVSEQASYGGVVTCSPFEGASRCVLGCEVSADCPAQMTCLQGVCVWSMDPSLEGELATSLPDPL